MRVTPIRRSTNIGIATLVLLSMLSFSPGVATAAGTTELISITPGGSAGNSGSSSPSISNGGSLVAFVSSATDLVAGDTNGFSDVFVRNRVSGTNERVSVSSSGIQGNSLSGWPDISADGRYVAFHSFASNLVAGDNNGEYDVFVHDRNTDTTTLVSVSSTGVLGNGDSVSPSISADGRYIAFESVSTNLIPGDTNGVRDVFVHDRIAGTTERVSVVNQTGAQGSFVSNEPSISADGRYVAFTSGSAFVPPFVPTELHIYVRDRNTGETILASHHSDGTPANDNSQWPSISGNGQYVAFRSTATNLDDNFAIGMFVHDLVNGTTELVSLDMNGDPAGVGTKPSISSDGRYVAYESSDSNIVANDTNGVLDAFVRDRVAGVNERVSVSSAGVEANGHTFTAVISPDGMHVAFHTTATNLTPEPDTNGTLDVFVHDRQPANQAPIVDLGDAQALGDEGTPFIRNGVFADPDSAAWTATVDYGDGAGPVNLPLVGMGFTLNHSYADNAVYTVTVCVTDDGNETGCDSIPVTISNVAPAVDAGPDQNVEVGNTVNLDPATFSDPGTADTHTATIDWGDGSPLDNGAVNQGASTVSGSHVYNTTGQFTVEVCVADDDAGEGCDSFQVDVSDQQVNQAPQVDAGANASINEGDTFSQNGSFTDPDSATWTATVNYGDGSGMANLPLTGLSFDLSHTYTDNGVYAVEVCVTDDGGAEGCDTVQATVNNVSPSLDAGSDQNVEVGDTVNLDPASFSDPSTADTHTATIDWGDGSAIEPGTVDQAAGTVSGSHSYNSAGQFSVEVCVTDDDGGEGCDSFTVTVSEQQANQPPIVDLGDAQATGVEGAPFVRNGLFGDNDSTSWTATVDYGDGGGPVNLPLAGMNFTLDHTYADNGVYTVEVCVTDDGGAEGCDSIPVTIFNVAPDVNAGPDQVIVLGTPLNLTPASFTDPGTADTHNATIDWGDGSPAEAGIVDQASNTVSGGHTYAADGMFSVNLCVIDDDGAQGCDSFEVTVHDAPQIEGHLCVSQHTNLIRMPNGDCGPMQTRLDMPDDLPLTICAGLYTDLLRYGANGSCSRLDWRIDLPEDAPVDVCVSTFTTLVRYVSEPVECTRYEQHRVIGEATTPPDRGNPRLTI